MTKTRKIVLLTIALVSLDGLLTHGQSQSQVARVETPLRPEEHDRLFVIGKRLFVECCAKCHATDAGARKATRALLTLQWNCAKVTNVPAAHASKVFEAVSGVSLPPEYLPVSAPASCLAVWLELLGDQ